MTYKKFCYWKAPLEFEKIKKEFEGKGIRFKEESHIPCRVLRPSKEIAYVPETAWNGFCARRTSWYWTSDKAGQFLIVSEIPLEGLSIENTILISESGFKPLRLPSYDEILGLISSNEYQKRKPLFWEKVGSSEKEFYQIWFRRHYLNEPFDFERIFESHSANHANFINPKFFINQNGLLSPYSIADSLHVCSSCLEFFNILGAEWVIKYVVPCIGAVVFARLPLNQYFEVKLHALTGGASWK